MLLSTPAPDTEIKDYIVVRLDKDRLPDLAQLYKAVYGTYPGAGYFSRKYDTAYTGVNYVGFIAYNRQGVPVAYYGVIPCLIQYGTERMLSAQSADTMTHPGFRYKGMFVELSNRTFDLCRDLGISLIFGFPNQNSYHGAIYKLGWVMTETMECFIIPVNSLPVESFARKLSFLQKFYRRYRQFVLNHYSLPEKGLSNAVVAEGFAGVCRNDSYLEYKQFSRTRVIRINDSTLWISDKPGLLIGDMEGVDENNFAAVIRKVKRMAMKLGVRQLQFHTSPGTRLHGLFAAHYRAMASYPVLFQDFGSTIPPAKIKFTFADIDIF